MALAVPGIVRQVGKNRLRYTFVGTDGPFDFADASTRLKELYKVLSAPNCQKKGDFQDLATLFLDLREATLSHVRGSQMADAATAIGLKDDEWKLLSFNPFDQNNGVQGQTNSLTKTI